MTKTNNEITINIYFSKTEKSSLDEIKEWFTEFEDKMTVSNISYDKNWTETKTRVEFTGIYRSKDDTTL